MASEQIPDDVNSNSEKTLPAELNGNAEVQAVSKLRESIPQVCAVCAKNLLLITFGSTLGFSAILIPELKKDHSEIQVNTEQLSWISSINLILVPVGCVFSGPISQFFGRRKTMMIATVPFTIAWLLFHYATNPTTLLIALCLTGITGGLIEAPVLTYVAEITQPHVRGMLSATSTTSVILGVFTQLLAGSMTGWRTVALINTAYPVLCFAALCLVPESPYWLAGKGRLQSAERALCWLRGWVTPLHVRKEFQALCKSMSKPAGKESEGTIKEKPWIGYTRRTFYLPFTLMIVTFFISAFGGVHSLQTFAVVIFSELNAPIDNYTAAVFLGAAELAGTLICISAIHFTGKRKLSFLSTVGTGLGFFGTAVYTYMIDEGKLNGEKYTWVPMTLLIGAAFMSHVGIKLLPWILIGEVFPGQVRSGASGAASSIAYVFNFIVNKVFLYMNEGITLAGTFWFYASVNLLGTVALYFILPETEGRTLEEIENHYAGIHNLKDKPKKNELTFKEQCSATNPIPINDDIESKL
ncbi:facilitated trehalose transporter Tret1 [Cephus cinctus]|uniref:Facilitated trehalose transporter Tret1 n=1 Tax=Cephus cinctus TaxID=211228 RepID=A0AAJ7FN58_CEPCN|nr:facilitated trehalose transporter Tret1 [Cephus cinctus]